MARAVNVSVCIAADILMWRRYRLQLVAMNVHIGPQLVKSRTGVSKLLINSTAGQSSGWALPRILVCFFLFFVTDVRQNDVASY